MEKGPGLNSREGRGDLPFETMLEKKGGSNKPENKKTGKKKRSSKNEASLFQQGRGRNCGRSAKDNSALKLFQGKRGARTREYQ